MNDFGKKKEKEKKRLYPSMEKRSMGVVFFFNTYKLSFSLSENVVEIFLFFSFLFFFSKK